VTAVIVFGIIVLVCAEEVIRLAKDARTDMDSGEREPDVFARRWLAAKAALLCGRRLVSSGHESITTAGANVAAIRARRRMESPTVRIPRSALPALARR
jgi:hypothetical protein